MSGSSSNDDGTTPSTSIVSRTPADTGRPQEVVIVPQYSTLANQVLWWNPVTGQPEWRLIGDIDNETVYGAPRPLLMHDTLPLLAGDGLPYLFRGALAIV